MKQHASGALQLMHRIKVGPPIVTIHQGNSFIVTTAEAEITPDA